MAEIEIAGAKIKGSKLLLVLPVVFCNSWRFLGQVLNFTKTTQI